MTILAHPASVSSHYLYHHHHLHIIILCHDPVHLWHNMVWCCCKQLQTRMSMSRDHTVVNSVCIDEQKLVWTELIIVSGNDIITVNDDSAEINDHLTLVGRHLVSVWTLKPIPILISTVTFGSLFQSMF